MKLSGKTGKQGVHHGEHTETHECSGRIQYDMLPIVTEMEEYLEGIHKNIDVAIMGCPVNGPTEAKRADVGVAGGKDCAILFKKGQIVATIPQADIIKVLKEEIAKL